MKWIAIVTVLAIATPARAKLVRCIGPHGMSPAPGSVLPIRPTLAFYQDAMLRNPPAISATIDGAKVALEIDERDDSGPFRVFLIVVTSAKTGRLVITPEGGDAPYVFTIAKRTVPASVSGVIGRYQGPSRADDPSEMFDGLAIRLPATTPAVLGHVKYRLDGATAWNELEVPIYTPLGESRPMIRVGEFQCRENADLRALARGFDLTATVTLADGTIREVKDLAPHLTLPAPLPPQPRPKNQRPGDP